MKASDCDVVVRDVGVDAAVKDQHDGRPLLILRPHMSRGAAVQAIMGVLPLMSPDEAAKIVRAALPDAVDFDDVLVRRVDASGAGLPAKWWRSVVMPLGWAATLGLCIGSGMLAAVLLWHPTQAPQPVAPVEPAGDHAHTDVRILPLRDSGGQRVCVTDKVAWTCNPPSSLTRADITPGPQPKTQ